MVGLSSACSKYHLCALRLCLGQKVLKLTDFVSAQTYSDKVIPLDPYIGSQKPGNVFKLVERYPYTKGVC